MAILLVRRRLLLLLFIAITLVVTFTHLAGYSTWQGVYPIPGVAKNLPHINTQHLKWDAIPMQNPVSSMVPLPTGEAPKIPRIQYDFSQVKESPEQKKIREDRLNAVKEAFKHSWKGYKDHAWLHDEVAPVSGGPREKFGGWGATLIDSLDTLWIMDLHQEFEEAVDAAKSIDFTQTESNEINVFETTIRYLGGFLSAYDITGKKYPILLEKATQVGDLLYRAFDTPNHMPETRWKWKEYIHGVEQDSPDSAVVAELGSLSLEFTRLSQLTSDPKYYDMVQRITKIFQREQSITYIPGLWPTGINPRKENLHSDHSFTFGGMADSTFEYLPKQYILLSGRNDEYREMHIKAMEAAKKYLVFQPLIPPPPSERADSAMEHGPLLVGTARGGDHIFLEPKGEHLGCFAGGMFALGAKAMAPLRSSKETEEDLDVAKRLAHGCVWSYMATPTGIGPEIFHAYHCRKGRDAVTSGAEKDWEDKMGNCTWDRTTWLLNVFDIPDEPELQEEWLKTNGVPEGFLQVGDRKYILRPEAIESVFMMYRITGDRIWQEYAWQMFQKIVKHCKTDIAFSGLHSVTDPDGTKDDSMESFWTAETLKYFYLVFAPEDLVNLDEYVFNTEAHPFRWRKTATFSG